MKQLLRFKTFLLMAVLSLLAGTSAWAESDPFYTLDTTTEAARTTSNSYAGTGTVTLNGIEWTVNGNGQMSPWRLGGKSISNTDRTVNTNTAMGSAINKVVLTVGTANNITVNSLKLTVASDANFSNVLDEVTATFAASSDITFEPSTGTEWTTGAYYKFTFNVTVSGSSNKFVQFSGVKFYAPEGTSSNPSISADNVDIEYNATAGEIIYSVNNPATGGFLSASTTASWLTVGTVGETVPFTCDTNDGIERTATVTLTYTYGSESVSKNVLVTQAGNPNGPGTENNPYTVAQARAAIDAGSGTQGVYATGIVSAIPTAYNSQHSNITFNFVDNDGDTDFLQAYRCGGTDAADVQVGDIVVVYGNLTKYGSTYEFGQGCEVVSITHPVVAVATPTFDPVAGAYSEPQNVTISCATDGADIYYTTDGTEPDANSTPFTGAINVATTTTIKAIAYKGGESSAVAKGTYHITSVDNPYTVSQALGFDDSEYPIEQIYVHGIVSTAPTQAPTNYGQLTYYISDDGTTTNQLQVYKGQGLNAVEFTSQDDIQVGDEVTIIGNVKIYNNAKEFDTGNYLVAFNRPVVATPSITITPDTYEMDAKAGGGVLPVVCENLASDPKLAVVFVEADGTTPATYDWIQATINANGNIDGQITANDTGAARTAYFKVSGKAADGSTVYSNLVTFTQQAAATEPYITVNTGEVNFEATGGEKTLSFDYENLGSNPVFSIQYFESDGTTESSCGWISYQFDPNDNKVTINGQNNDEDAARTAYFKIYAEVNKTKIYSNLVTVNQAAPAVPVTGDYVKVTSTNDLTDGEYLIVYEDGNLAFDGNLTTLDASSNTVAVTIDNNTIASTTAVDAATFTIDVTARTIQSASGYYIGQTSDANGLKASNTEAYTNTMSIDADGNAVILASGGAYLRYNATSGQERFRYFKSSTYSSQKAIALYKKSSSPAPTTPSITLPDGYEFNVNAAGGDNELTVTCSNMPADPQLAVVFCDANGDAVADDTYDWITAVINANGNIDGHIDANTGDARTAYFKVSGKDADDNTIYSNLVTINQAAPAAPSILFNPASIDFEANAGNKTIGGDYFACNDFDSTPSLEILFYESDGATSATYNWLTVGFNNEGKINIAYDENTGAARSAYLKIHAVGTTVYSNLFTISQAAPTTDYVTLPFNWAGGASADLTAIAGVTASGIGSDYGATHDPYLVKFDSDGDYIQFKTNEQPGVVTIGVKMIGGGNTSTITVQGSADGDKFTDIEELTISGKQNDFLTLATTNEFDSSVRYIRLNFTKGSNVGVGPISIALPALVATPTFDPAAGEVQAGTLVTISTTTANATIRYTTDGSEPTTSNGEEYQKPIVINSDVTIKAIAVDDNQNVSAVAEATYTIATSSQLSPELTLDPKSLNVTEGAANGTVTVTTAAGYNGTITVMVDDPSVADASYDAGVITVVYGHAGSAVISVTAGADGDYVEQMEQISVNVSAPVQPAQAAVVVWSEDWSSFDLNDSETPAANGDFTYTYTDGNSATKLYDDALAGGTSPELLINKPGGQFVATIPLYGAYGNMTLTFKTNNKLTEVRAKVDDDTNNDITLDPATVNSKYVYTLPITVAEGAKQVVLTFTNNTSKNVRIDDFQLTAPQVAVNISSVGYATMYYGSSNLVVPAGVTASTYWVDGDLLKVSQEYTEGAVLAKAQGYVLSGAPGSYTFTATNDAANEDPKNLLCGSDVAVTTTAPVAGDYLFYLLGVDNGKVGFYWGKADGAAFKSGAHKAYLAVPTEQASGLRGFSFDGSVVGINTIGVDMPEGNAYDLQGRRVQQLQKNGLYIVDGKKMLAK